MVAYFFEMKIVMKKKKIRSTTSKMGKQKHCTRIDCWSENVGCLMCGGGSSKEDEDETKKNHVREQFKSS